MQGDVSPERTPSRALPDLSALAASPGKAHGAVNSAPIEALLQIVSKGHSLLADLLRTSSLLPPALRPQAINDDRYAAVLFDYRYFKDREALERKIEASPELTQLDEHFREVHGALLQQVFGLCEQLVMLHASITEFLQHLQAGGFIQCTLDTLLLTAEGKQLLCEALALLGTLLLALDRRLQGPVRERVIVAYYRLRGGSQAVGPSANAVIALCAATGLDAVRKRSPAGYPEAYFARLSLPQDVVLRLINTIRADDIYGQTAFFPAPEHRTTALASQASLLYLLLCFSPQTLHRDGSLMRTLVDRHFADNWVVAWGPGFYTDLAVEWDGFRAARAALAGVVSVTRARDVAATIAAALPELHTQLATHLSKGRLNEEYVLEHMSDILASLRTSNVSLRWLLLQSSGSQKKLRAAVASAAPPGNDLLTLLLEISQLEDEVKQVYSKLLESKQERWTAQQAALKSSITGLAKFFAALQSLPSEGGSPPDFSVWFEHLHQQVDEMNLDDPGGSSRRVQGVVAALNELERFHSGEASLQTAHYLSVIRSHLAHLLRLADVRPDMLNTLAAVSDFSYGWGLLDSYGPRLQAQIRRQPGMVGKLSSLFTKACSMLELPLMRLSQAKSGQLADVSRYYSSTLLAFARRVLQVVPGSLWELIDGMVSVYTHHLESLGSRVEVAALRDTAKLEQRAALVGYASRIAAFASGIHKIDRSSVGCVELDAMQLMEDGLRQLLAMRIAGATASLLTFPQSAMPLLQGSPFRQQRGGLASVFGTGSSFSGDMSGREDLGSRLQELGRRLDSVRLTLENVQDFVDLPGLQIWYQQVCSVVGANLAKEVIHLRQSAAEAAGKAADTRPYTPMTFLGRVVGELLRLSSPDKTQFSPLRGVWQDAAGHQVLGPAHFRHAGAGLSAAGLSALDHLLGWRVHFCLKNIFASLATMDSGTKEGLQMLRTAESGASADLAQEAPAAYADAAKRCSAAVEPLLEALLAIGQAQLLRRQLLLELRNIFMLDGASQIGAALAALNEGILEHERLRHKDGGGGDESAISKLGPIGNLAEACGMEDPMHKVYVVPAESPQQLPELLFLVVLSAAGQLRFERRSSMLLRQHKNSPDATVLAAGLATLLQQLKSSYLEAVLRLAGKWVRSYVQAVTGSVAQGIEAAGIQVALPREVGTLLAFLRELGRFGDVPDSLVARHIPFVYDTWLSVFE